ncbi:MAG: cobalamin B12-binding domain-containing protein [Pseudothermotoga sp.]
MKIYRILIAKPGLDGHDRGAKVVAHALRDAGFEVIYTGLRQTPQQIVRTAIQEDVDLIGLSILSGAHLQLSQKVIELMKQEGVENIPVFVGGIIPPDDVPKLLQIGVKRVFGPGTPLSKIVEEIKTILGQEVANTSGS